MFTIPSCSQLPIHNVDRQTRAPMVHQPEHHSGVQHDEHDHRFHSDGRYARQKSVNKVLLDSAALVAWQRIPFRDSKQLRFVAIVFAAEFPRSLARRG